MRKKIVVLLAAMCAAAALAGCGKKEEQQKPQLTETYDEKNTITVVHHDTENVDFRIAVIKGEMATGLENLMADAKKGEAANRYRFYLYDEFSMFKSLFDCGTVRVATLTLEDALSIYRENPDFICLLAVNSDTEDGVGVTVANTKFAREYPSALKIFMEEMLFSAKEATCVTGEEMRSVVEEQLIAMEEELPGDEFYYPLPELPEDEVIDVEELENND